MNAALKLTLATAAVASLVVAACQYDSDTRNYDPHTGNLTSSNRTRVTVDPVAVTAPGVTVRTGDGRERTTGTPFEVYDTNNDGEPDLVRDPATGKFYRLTAYVHQLTNPDLWIVDVYQNDPTRPQQNGASALSGGQLCRAYGFDAITAAGGGVHTLSNTLVYGVTPDAANLLNSVIDLGVRQSSDWRFADFVEHRDLRYEILGVPPANLDNSADTALREPWLFLFHVEGSFLNVARWMAANGTEHFEFRADPALTLSFDVDSASRTLSLYANNTLLGRLPL